MNIIFLTRLFYPKIGGVEKHVWELGKKLTEKGHKVIVITENFSSTKLENDYQPASGKVDGIEIIRIQAGRADWFKKFRIWAALWQLRQLFEKADVIHCHDVFFWYLPFRFIYPSKKVFTTFHGYESYPIAKKAILMRKISENLSAGNICIGDFIKKWYGTKPTFVSYGGVNNDLISDSVKIKKDSAFFFGRLDSQTGIKTYVNAFKIIKKKFPKFDFLVVGDGEYKRFIPKIIKVKNFTNNPQIYFKNYNFVFVSRYLSMLEGLVAKKIIIAVYDNPIKEDYLRTSPFANFIYICKNTEEVVEVIESVKNAPWKSASMIEKGYNWAIKQTWDEVTKIYLRLWKI